MLTQDACTVLSRIHASSVKSYAFVGTPQYQTFLDLKALNYIRVDHNDYCSLTPSGLSYLLSLQQQFEQQSREEEARQKTLRLERKRIRKDARRSWWQWLLSGLLSLLLVFLGAYLTLSTSWFNWLQSFIP